MVGAAQLFGEERARLSPEFTFDDGESPASVSNWERIRLGTDPQSVILRLGPPAAQGDPRPLEDRKGTRKFCFGYSNETAKTEILALCFENGRLVSRERL